MFNATEASKQGVVARRKRNGERFRLASRTVVRPLRRVVMMVERIRVSVPLLLVLVTGGSVRRRQNRHITTTSACPVIFREGIRVH